MLFHYNTGTMTMRTANIQREYPHNFVQINTLDAQKLGIKKQQKVRVKTRRGELEVEAEVTDKIKPGVIWMPFHFSHQPTNILTNNAFDPVCKTAEYKACAARIDKV